MRLLNNIDEKLEKRLEDHARRKSTMEKYPVCNVVGECFARRAGKCIILSDTDFRSGECPFRKPDRGR